jgi:hypothetical protein
MGRQRLAPKALTVEGKFDRGIVATKTILDFESPAWAIPAPLLMMLLGPEGLTAFTQRSPPNGGLGVPAHHVGDDVGLAGVVVDADFAAFADGGDDLVGHGAAGGEVEVAGRR